MRERRARASVRACGRAGECVRACASVSEVALTARPPGAALPVKRQTQVRGPAVQCSAVQCSAHNDNGWLPIWPTRTRACRILGTHSANSNPTRQCISCRMAARPRHRPMRAAHPACDGRFAKALRRLYGSIGQHRRERQRAQPSPPERRIDEDRAHADAAGEPAA